VVAIAPSTFDAHPPFPFVCLRLAPLSVSLTGGGRGQPGLERGGTGKAEVRNGLEKPAPIAIQRLFEELEPGSRRLRREADQETAVALWTRIDESLPWEQLVRRMGARAVAHAGAGASAGGVGRLPRVPHSPGWRWDLAPGRLWTGHLDGSPAGVAGAIEAVGADYLEVAEHDPGESRRRAAVKARRFVGLAAVVAVTLPPAPR
jgi:hypothetical protein